MAKLSEEQCVKRAQDFIALEPELKKLLPRRDLLRAAVKAGDAVLWELKGKKPQPSLPSRAIDLTRDLASSNKSKLVKLIVDGALTAGHEMLVFYNSVQQRERIQMLESALTEVKRMRGDVEADVNSLRDRMTSLKRIYNNGGCPGHLHTEDHSLLDRARR